MLLDLRVIEDEFGVESLEVAQELLVLEVLVRARSLGLLAVGLGVVRVLNDIHFLIYQLNRRYKVLGKLLFDLIFVASKGLGLVQFKKLAET